MQNQPPTELLDNTQISPATGRYVAHVAVACRDVREAAEWYSSVVGAKSVRILDDRVTLSVGGVLQMVCHLAPDYVEISPHPYPRHVGLTFFARRGLCAHVGSPPFDKAPLPAEPDDAFSAQQARAPELHADRPER